VGNCTKHKQTKHDNGTNMDGEVWKKPPPDKYKCNFDASFSSTQNKVGICFYIRDENNIFVFAKSECFSPIIKVGTGEALGMLFSMLWSKELRLMNVDFKLDSKNVVSKFHNFGEDHSDL